MFSYTEARDWGGVFIYMYSQKETNTTYSVQSIKIKSHLNAPATGFLCLPLLLNLHIKQTCAYPEDIKGGAGKTCNFPSLKGNELLKGNDPWKNFMVKASVSTLKGHWLHLTLTCWSHSHAQGHLDPFPCWFLVLGPTYPSPHNSMKENHLIQKESCPTLNHWPHPKLH